MLKMQQGEYVGYDAFDKDVTISKLPLSVSKEGLNYKQEVDIESWKQDTVFDTSKVETDDNLDMTTLKSSSSQTTDNRRRNSRHNGQSFHNSYTIYEEASDLSGNETGANSICSVHSSTGSLNKLQPEGENHKACVSKSQMYRCISGKYLRRLVPSASSQP